MTPQEMQVHSKQEHKEDSTREGRTYVPNIDVCETADSLWLWAEMPGVDEKSVDINLADGVLTIEGRVALGDYEDLSPAYTEYNVGNFRRRLSVSDDVDTEHIEARMKDGVLSLKLPKAERAKARRIPVAAA